MSEKYKFRDPDGIYFVTLTVVHWIDLFTRRELTHVIVDALSYCVDQKGLVVHAWVIMPSHIHMIVHSENGNLSNILRDLKKYTSRELIKTIKIINESRKEWLLRAFEKEGERLKRVTKYKVWRDGNHPVLLDTNKMIDGRLAYLHHNPVESEVVSRPEDYIYSSACDYVGIKGVLKIELIG